MYTVTTIGNNTALQRVQGLLGGWRPGTHVASTGDTLERDVKPHQPLRNRREAQLCAMELMACRYVWPDTCSCHRTAKGGEPAIHAMCLKHL